MKNYALVLVLSCFTVSAAFAETPSADEVMAKAQAEALAGQKTIFVHFGASWCGWCGRLEAFLERAEVKTIFDKYFVPVKLVVQEEDPKKALNNPGGDKLLEKLGGPDGLPFFAFLDAHGALIVNCKRPTAAEPTGESVAFPVEPKEVEWFLQMIRKAAPKISQAELDTIQASLKSMSK